MNTLKSLFKKLAANPVVSKTFHTAWQAGVGAFIAALVGAHGDARTAVIIGGAAAAAAAKNVIVQSVPAADVTPAQADTV